MLNAVGIVVVVVAVVDVVIIVVVAPGLSYVVVYVSLVVIVHKGGMMREGAGHKSLNPVVVV